MNLPDQKATEQLLRQIFEKHKETPIDSRTDLNRELTQAFQLFRSDYDDQRGSDRKSQKKKEIQERITNLQRRTSDTLRALTNCKENLGSVAFLDLKPKNMSDIDEAAIPDTRNLGELTNEMERLQTGESSTEKSVLSLDRPDIENMKSATDKLLDELGRISKSYTEENNSSQGWSTSSRN